MSRDLKFKTSERRRWLCKEWCAHLSKGLTRESFPYCDPETFRKYRKVFPQDMNEEAIEEAERRQIMAWELRLAMCATKGTGNATAIIYALKNVCRWTGDRMPGGKKMREPAGAGEGKLIERDGEYILIRPTDKETARPN